MLPTIILIRISFNWYIVWNKTNMISNLLKIIYFGKFYALNVKISFFILLKFSLQWLENVRISLKMCPNPHASSPSGFLGFLTISMGDLSSCQIKFHGPKHSVPKAKTALTYSVESYEYLLHV